MFGSNINLTAVDSDPQLQLLLGAVTHLERFDGIQEGEGHASDLPAMQLPVSHRQP